MTNSPEERTVPPKRTRIRLPFENKKEDIGSWSYDHRVGICITVIVYLLIGISFMFSRIDFTGRNTMGMILVDFGDEPRDMEERPVREYDNIFEDYSSVSNRVSNENAELNSELRDDRGTNVSELYERAGNLNEGMESNRRAFEEGLTREPATERNNMAGSDDGEQRTTARVQGNVTVSYSFTNPVRNDRHLVVPAYLCEGGGQVVINATLDRNGNVTSASVDRSLSTPDQCLHNSAIRAARQSRFNLDESAPQKHNGTITYLFIPQ